MTAGIVVDVIIVIALIAALVGGLRRGLLLTLGSAAGMIAGGIVALLVMPILSSLVPWPGWNVVIALAAGIIIVGLCVSVGSWIGSAVGRPVRKLKLGGIDRLLGGAVSLVVALMVVLMLGMSSSALGLPAVTQATASSKVLSALERTTPPQLLSGLSQLRALVITDGIPTVLDAAGVPGDATIPDADTDTPALRKASQSVTRITANAPSCGTRSSGSGFVFDGDLVMTNSHVVAGSTDVVVEAPDALPHEAVVVYNDPDADVAVLKAPGLDRRSLPFDATPDAGATVFFQGYPFGGPFTSRSAQVIDTGDMNVSDIYHDHQVTRSVTTLAGKVEPGNSGGPLLSDDGAVIGMIFAKGEHAPNAGFALSMTELSPVIARADTFTSPVPTGACTAD